MKSTMFKKLNNNWNAEPNVAIPLCYIDGTDLLVIFHLNKFIYPENPEQTIGMLRFNHCARYRVSQINMDAWFMGNCRFSKLAPDWGEFYQVSGDLLLDHCVNDWIQVSQSDNSLKHFLFYFRDMEFECEAQDWSFEALEDVKELNSISKFLSLILRHKPDEIGLKLDDKGWLKIIDIIDKSTKNNIEINLELILKVVYTNSKKRFSISKDGQYIRANQGHSILVDIETCPKKPPDFLFHGTATRFLESIEEKGVLNSGRLQVHLTEDYLTAIDVGNRYGIAVVLEVNSLQMYNDGIKFYQAANDVWLTEYVNSKYFRVLKD